MIYTTQSKSQDAGNAQNAHNKQKNATLTKSDNISTIISVQIALHISLQNTLDLTNLQCKQKQHMLKGTQIPWTC